MKPLPNYDEFPQSKYIEPSVADQRGSPTFMVITDPQHQDGAYRRGQEDARKGEFHPEKWGHPVNQECYMMGYTDELSCLVERLQHEPG